MLHWHVSKKDPNVPSQAEAGGNAFVEDGEELPNPATNLVRESLQNSLDKRRDHSIPVRVRFCIAAMPQNAVQDWFGELQPHIESSWPRGLNRALTQPRVLIIEDFNTHGLNGSTEITNLRDAGPSNDFFFFWRAQNLSPKSGQGGGSWGVGKTTYYLLSHVGTILGWSVPSDAKHSASIMGRCHLREHSLQDGGDVYQHFGYGCDPTMPNSIALPLTSRPAIDEFREAWPVTRTDQSGLSIIIPYLRVDLQAQNLISAVIEEYPHPLVSGDLVVEVCDEHGSVTEISAETVDALANEVQISGKVAKHLKLCQFLQAGSEPLVLPDQSPTSRPSGDTPENLIDSARVSLGNGGFAHFRVPLRISKRAENGTENLLTDYIDVVLQESDTPTLFYVRSGLWVKGEPQSGVPRPKNMDALMVLHRPTASATPSIAELLGRFEGPSHRLWDSTLDDEMRPDPYTQSHEVRAFVRRLPSELARAIMLRTDTERFSLAEDWFNISSQGAGAGGRSNPQGRGGVQKPQPKVTGPAKIAATLDPRNPSKIHFKLQGKSRIPLLIIRLGYEQQDRARSSNLDKWVASDFELRISRRPSQGKLAVGPSQGRKSFAERIDKNSIICRGVDPAQFGLEVAGFDVARGVQWDAKAFDEQGQPIELRGGAL